MSQLALFDFDGTLANTDDIHLLSWNMALEQFEIELTRDFYTSYFVGVLSLPVAQHFIDKYERIPISAEELASLKDAIFHEYISQEKVSLMFGVRELLQLLSKNGFEMGIVSGSPLVSIRQVLDDNEIHQYFKLIVAREHIREGKPNPEGYLVALNTLAADPKTTLSFEDTKSGVRAARAAGVISFAVSQSLTAHHDFSNADFRCFDLFDVMNILNYQ